MTNTRGPLNTTAMQSERGRIKTGELECPAGLSPGAVEHWRWLVEQVRALGFEDRADSATLAMAAMAYDLAMIAYEQISRDGLLVDGRRGGIVKHPASVVFQQQMDRYIRIVAQFGLSPVSRMRMGGAAVDDGDEFDAWASGSLDVIDGQTGKRKRAARGKKKNLG